MEYIKQLTKTPDGKLLSIGHSMGGILLYAMLSKCSKGFLTFLLPFKTGLSFEASHFICQAFISFHACMTSAFLFYFLSNIFYSRIIISKLQ